MTAIVMVDGIAYTRKEGVPCYDSGLGWRECQSDESHLAGALVDAQDELATLRAQLAGVREALRTVRETYEMEDATRHEVDAALSGVPPDAVTRLPAVQERVHQLPIDCYGDPNTEDTSVLLARRERILAAL